MAEQEQHGANGGDADELLRRALLDPDASAAIALRIDGLSLSDAPAPVPGPLGFGLRETDRHNLTCRSGRGLSTIV